MRRTGRKNLWNFGTEEQVISKKQKKILAFPYSPYDALICDGAVRSGKTSLMTVAFVDWAMREFSCQRFGICGKTVDSASKNIIVPYTMLNYANKRYTIRWRRSEKVMEVRRGKRVNIFEVFGGKDEASAALIQGRTLAGVLLDEVALMPRSFVEQAMARCSVEGNKLWFSCNPRGRNHWFYQELILKAKKKNILRLHFEMTDNPSLSEKTLEQYRTRFTGIFYDWYVRGMWVDPTGLVYQVFNEKEHTTGNTPWLDGNGTTRPGTQYYISIDYGILNPFSAGLWAVYRGKAYRWREYYHDGRKNGQRTDEEHYEAVRRLAGDLPIELMVVDPSASSFITTVNRHGIFAVAKAVNDVLPGIATVSSLLAAGRLKIGSACTNCISEFGLYAWAADNDDVLKEEVVKENDHAMDDTRYFCHTILRNEFDWLNWG